MSEKKFNIVGIIGGALYILGNFIPIIHFYDGSELSLISVELTELIFAIISLAFCFKTFKSGLANGIALMGFGLIEIFCAFIYYNDWYKDSGGELGFGMYLLFIGSIVTFAGGIYALVQRKKNS